MPRPPNTRLRDDIVRLLESGEATIRQIAQQLHTSCQSIDHHIEVLCKEHRVSRRSERTEHLETFGRHFVYFLKGTDTTLCAVASPGVTGAPYRNLRLTEDLVGYEGSLFRHAGLCMVVRK